MRATQQQFGALLRLSMTDGLEERAKESEMPHEAISGAGASVVANSALSPVMDKPTALTRSSSSYAVFERLARNEAPSLSNEQSSRAIDSAPMAVTDDATPYVA